MRLLRLLVLLQIGQGITVWGQQINSGKTEACEFLNDAWPTLLANHQVLYPTADKIISFLSIRQQLKYWANFNSRKYTGLDEKMLSPTQLTALTSYIHFRIFRNWWFYILCLIILSALTTWIINRTHNNHLREKEVLKRRIQSLTNTARVQKKKVQQQNQQLETSIQAQKRLELIANTMDNPVIICALNGGIIWANKSFYTIFEGSPNPTDKKLWEISGNNEIEDCFWNCLFNKTPNVQQIKTPKTETDIERLFQVTLTPVISPSNKVKEIIGVYSNVTNLYDLNSTRDMLMTVITHDLQSHLLAFKLICETLLTQLRAENHPSVRELSHMNNQASALYTFSDSLSDWLKNQKGKIQYIPENIKLNQVVDEVISLFKLQSQLKHIRFRNIVSENMEIRADKNMLKTIFRNLFSNAIDHGQQGTITIHANSNGKQAIIRVKDEGLGAEKQDLFNKEHTGFGLFICEEFINQNLGTIWQESVTTGTCIAFSLPLVTTQIADVYEKENYNC